MKKVDDKQVFMIVAVLCVAVLVCGYFFVYKKMADEAESLRKSNASLRSRIESLKDYYDNEQYYRDTTELILADLDEMLEPYAADAREEDAIVHGIQMQTASAQSYSQIAIADQEEVKRISYADFIEGTDFADRLQGNEDEEMDEADGESEEEQSEFYPEDIVFYSRTATYTTELSYQGLKKAVEEILGSDYQMGISLLTFSGDADSALLRGSMALDFYSVAGAGLSYEEPDVAEYLTGMSDIMGFTQ